MTCSECQGQIFEGDLDRDAVVHLTGCEGCRVLDREVRLNAEALAAMRDDVMPIRTRRRWPWMVAAAAVVLAVIGIGYRPQPAPAEPDVAVVRPQPVEPVLPEPVVVERPAVRPVRAAKPAPPSEPMLVKLLTDDPEVVIYWLIEPQGEKAL